MNTFQEIYTENYSKIFRVAMKMLGDTDKASDVVQEVFISLYDNYRKGNIILHPGTWLYRAAINKSIDSLRGQKKNHSLESLKEYATNTEQDDQDDRAAIISKALSTLKESEKTLVVLYSEGLSYKEISEATGIRFSSLGKTLSRALKKVEIELKNKKYELY